MATILVGNIWRSCLFYKMVILWCFKLWRNASKYFEIFFKILNLTPVVATWYTDAFWWSVICLFHFWNSHRVNILSVKKCNETFQSQPENWTFQLTSHRQMFLFIKRLMWKITRILCELKEKMIWNCLITPCQFLQLPYVMF